MIRKFINFLGIATSVAILASCSGATENLEDNQVETKQETAVEVKTTENQTAVFSTVENDCQKIKALKSAYTKKGDVYYPNIPPVLTDAEEVFADVGMTGKKINEIPEAVKKAVVANIFVKLNKRLPEFTVLRNEKYSDCTNDLTYHDIEKGDIILSVTHNDFLMAIDGENVVHHATLCIKTPESNADTAFITIEGVGKNIAYFSLDDIRDNDDTAYVMRCKDITAEQINEIVEFAQKQIGKPYNTNFIKKEEEESFYCTQLVWAAYKAAGIGIDFNANEINDYGVVLATDIYKSPNLKLVKYSD